ncbi:MAG: hypothetical protein IKG46_00480 [Solobacterium sp.]|nr:hypothetical protein [Solobacterium sp.]
MHSSEFEKLKQQLLGQQDDLDTLSEQLPEDPGAQALVSAAEKLEEPVQFDDPETEEMLKKTDELIQQFTGSE